MRTENCADIMFRNYIVTILVALAILVFEASGVGRQGTHPKDEFPTTLPIYRVNRLRKAPASPASPLASSTRLDGSGVTMPGLLTSTSKPGAPRTS